MMEWEWGEAATRLPSVRGWERDDPDAQTPQCPQCGRSLGIRRAMFAKAGRDVWLCEAHGEIDP